MVYPTSKEMEVDILFDTHIIYRLLRGAEAILLRFISQHAVSLSPLEASAAKHTLPLRAMARTSHRRFAAYVIHRTVHVPSITARYTLCPTQVRAARESSPDTPFYMRAQRLCARMDAKHIIPTDARAALMRYDDVDAGYHLPSFVIMIIRRQSYVVMLEALLRALARHTFSFLPRSYKDLGGFLFYAMSRVDTRMLLMARYFSRFMLFYAIATPILLRCFSTYAVYFSLALICEF